MDDWTVKLVETRLAEAADVMRRLPPVRVPGYFSTWPRALVEFADLVGQQPEPMRLPPPSTAAITEWKKRWLVAWLEGEDAKLVWARADRTPGRQSAGGSESPAPRQSAMAVRTERDRVAAQWTKSAGEAVEEICNRDGGTGLAELSNTRLSS